MDLSAIPNQFASGEWPICAIASGGGAAKLLAASARDGALGLEKAWRQEHPDALPLDEPLQPYATMT